MKNYVKTYHKYFNYYFGEFIPCEICQKQAVDIHHIENRKRRMDLINDINNLMALCRKCHETYGDKNQYLEFLKKVHNEKLHTK